MRLPIDMNLTARRVFFLRNCRARRGPMVVSSADRISAKDSETCDFGREHSYALLTDDLDSPRILAHTDKLLPASSYSAVNR